MKKGIGVGKLIGLKTLLVGAAVTAMVVGLVSVVRVNSMKSGADDVVGVDVDALREKQLENGARAKVNAVIKDRETGTPTFDSESGAGNDTSAYNDIVRSFDSVTWYISPSIQLKNPGDTLTDINDGVIVKLEAEVDIPTEWQSIPNIVTWDTEYMAWLQNPEISNDGRKISGEYVWLFSGDVASADIVFTYRLNVNGAPNNMNITPRFSVMLAGGSDSDKISDIPFVRDNENPSNPVNNMHKVITVTAKPAYNIRLSDPNSLKKSTTLTDGVNTYKGRACGFAFILQLDGSQQPAGKGFKGLEIPKGDITFDVNLKLTKAVGTGYETDISANNIVLWNYKINVSNNDGVIPGRSMDIAGDYASEYACYGAPYGIAGSDRKNSVYDSGSIQMTPSADGTKLSVTVSNYKFDGKFPLYDTIYDENSAPEYPREGCFSAGYFEIIVLDRAYSKNDGNTYKLYVTDNNFSATSLSNQRVTTQIKTNDDAVQRVDIAGGPGVIRHSVTIHDTETRKILGQRWVGDEEAFKDQEITAYCLLEVFENNDDEDIPRSVDKLVKFDADGVIPYQKDGKWYEFKYLNVWDDVFSEKEWAGTPTVNHWFVTKPNGSNWSSQTERDQTDVKDLVLYNNYSDIPAGHKCVGEYFELDISGNGFQPRNYQVLVRLKVKNTANLGQTYSVVQSDKVFYQKLNRSQYSQGPGKKKGYDAYPARLIELLPDYRKTEYNEYGAIMENTHNDHDAQGNSFLVIDAQQRVSIETFDNKRNYFLDYNETTVNYVISPYLTTNRNLANIDGITEKITCTLPRGLTYSLMSTTNYGVYGEPEIVNNSDGSETLTWYIENCKTNENIEEIEFDAIISEIGRDNGTYVAEVVISEYVPSGGRNRLGVDNIELRTDNYTITTISTAAHTLYKGTSKSVIDPGEDLNYQIVVQNTEKNSDDPDFQLLDVFPYNNDNRGTAFHGSFVLKNITIKAYDMISGDELSASGFTLYTTTNSNITSDMTANQIDLSSGIWTRDNFGTLNKTARAIGVKGNLKRNMRLNIEFNLTPTGNRGSDTFRNNVSMQTAVNLPTLVTPYIPINGVNRSISGIAWMDIDQNGIIDDEEDRMKDVVIKLLYEDGQPVRDDYNNLITATTDENGRYIIEGLEKRNYILETYFESQDGLIKLTEMGVGDDEKVNSKFDPETKRTDVITTLNRSGAVLYEANYQNVGIAYNIPNVDKDNGFPLDVENIANRTISGNVWLDIDKDGIWDEDEDVIKDALVRLLYENGQPVTNESGNAMVKRTDVNGYYIFEDLKVRNYKLKIDYEKHDGIVSLTQKNIGNDEKVNSKFDPSNDMTDVISDLVDNQNIFDVKYQNAGIIYTLPEISDNIYDIEIENIPKGYIEITKIDSVTSEKLEGAKFGIYTAANVHEDSLVDIITTGTDGKAKSKLLVAGDYYVKELESPTNYKLNTEIKKAVVMKANDVVDEGKITFTNIPQGYIEVLKKNSVNGKPLSGAEFEIYKDAGLTQLVEKLTTGDDGIAKSSLLDVGTYYLKETLAPKNYMISEETKEVKVTAAGRTTSVEVENIPLGFIEITKVDSLNKTKRLKGAEFAIYRDRSASEESYIESIYTQEDGVATSSALPAGTYYVKEITPPLDYKLDDEMKTVVVKDAGEAVKIEIEDVPQGYLELTKTDSLSGKLLSGAVFGIYSDRETRDLVQQITTGASGKVRSDGLDAGKKYYLKEISAPAHYKISDDVVEFQITEAGQILEFMATDAPMGYIEVIKVDSVTRETLADAEFEIYSDMACTNKVADLRTGSDGRARSIELEAGTYYIKETVAPEGHRASTEIHSAVISKAGEVTEVEIENKPEGYIQIEKVDSVTEEMIPGATFGIYSDPDATNLIMTATVGEDGKVVIGPLEIGMYYVKEQSAPEGYRINSDIIEANLDRGRPVTDPLIVTVSDIPLGSENKYAEMYITIRKSASDMIAANEMNIDGLGEVLVYSNSVGRRDTNSVPGNALEIATNQSAWWAGYNSVVEGEEDGIAWVGKAVWEKPENDAYVTESVIVIPPLGVPLRDYKRDQAMYIIVCSATILAMLGLFGYKQVLIQRSYEKIRKNEEEKEKQEDEED